MKADQNGENQKYCIKLRICAASVSVAIIIAITIAVTAIVVIIMAVTGMSMAQCTFPIQKHDKKEDQCPHHHQCQYHYHPLAVPVCHHQ